MRPLLKPQVWDPMGFGPQHWGLGLEARMTQASMLSLFANIWALRLGFGLGPLLKFKPQSGRFGVWGWDLSTKGTKTVTT